MNYGAQDERGSRADVIVHHIAKAFRSQVTLYSLDRDVARQELDLLQLATCFVTELRAGSALMPHAALHYAESRNMPNRNSATLWK
jgi:hypothetical protein